MDYSTSHVIISCQYTNLLQWKVDLKEVAEVEVAKDKAEREAKAANIVKDTQSASEKEIKKNNLRNARTKFAEKWSSESVKRTGAKFRQIVAAD